MKIKRSKVGSGLGVGENGPLLNRFDQKGVGEITDTLNKR